MKNRFRINKHFIISLFAIVFSVFSLGNVFAQNSQENRTVITIENAKSTKYEKDKETGNDCIFLSGNVKISVAKGSTKNIISSDTIKYDRVTEMIYADGNVSLEQTTDNSGGQTVTALSLMFNASTLEGIFDDGRVVQTQSDALNLPSGSTLVVASDIFGRSESNTIAFKNGVLTFCDDENPHWNIKASRIWLLPGGEFAFFNALFYVGVIPVLYLPAFYYPKDELIFNPVFNYTKREGYSVQTTTYLLGRKPLDTSSSTSADDSDSTEKIKALFNFIRPSTLKEQKLEGLMLHNLDKDFSGDTSNYVKLLGDWYSNLGIMVGLEGVVKPKKIINNLEFSAKLGFTNTIFKNGTEYSAYSTTKGIKYQDESNLLGFELPFRYGANLKFSMSKPFTLNMSLPVYSDPYFNNDFSERNETMDWISYLTESAAGDDDDDTVNEISSFSWTLNSSYSVPLPKVIKPYINSLSFNLSSSVAFSTMTATELTNSDVAPEDFNEWKNNTPQKKFYYPSQVTPANISANLSGTLFSWPLKTSTTSNTKAPTFIGEFYLPEELKTEKQKQKELEEKQKELLAASEETASETATNNEQNNQEEELELFDKNSFPTMNTSSVAQTTIPGITFSSQYSIKPAFTSQLAYPQSSSYLKKPEDFEWNNLRSSMYTFKVPITLNNTFGYGGSFITANNSYSFNPVFQKHPFISTDEVKGGYTEEAAANLRKTDYAAEKRDLTNTNSVSVKPFFYIDGFKNTGITWRSTIKMVRTNFIGDEENPEWEYLTTDWSDPDSITTNSLDFTFATNQKDNKFSQSLTLTTTLSPQPEQYYGTLKLTFPYTTFSFETGFKQKSATDETWVKQPIRQNFTLSLFNNSLKLSESYNYNLEENYNDSFKLALTWKGLQLAYNMSYTTIYDFDEQTGWKARSGTDNKAFLPYSFSLAYAPSSVTLYTWKNRVSLNMGLSTSIVADLIRPTNSYFLFNPSVTFKINEFLNVSFSSSSRNSVLYRYFGKEIDIPGEKNIFVDLMNSFRFDDESLRKASGFKLKSLNFDITHELHDWDFSTSFKIEPRILTENGKTTYDFNPYVTIAISWRPMASMKAEIVDDYGEWKLNP